MLNLLIRQSRTAARIGLMGAGLTLLWGCPDDPSTPSEPNPNEQEPVPGPEGEVEVEITSLSPAANDEAVTSPFDATLSPDGTTAYYVALTETEEGETYGGVFQTAASGGDPTTLFVGEPLAAPVNVDVSIDGGTLYIADPGALEDEDESTMGAIFELPSSGGAVTANAATLGMEPRAVVVQSVDGTEYVYFSGITADRTPAVFRFTPGGSMETVHSGEPLDAPGGIAVTTDGVVYVVDSAPGDSTAKVIKVEDGTAEIYMSGIGVGYPAGAALTMNDGFLLVSGVNPIEGHDRVYRFDLATGQVGFVEAGIDGFAESAGLHRAHDADVFAWADSEANDTGTVYVLVP